MPSLTREAAVLFANQLRSARLAALADAEAFDGIIHVIERLGSYLTKERLGDKGEFGSLGKYAEEIAQLAEGSAMVTEELGKYRELLTPFTTLYHSVVSARNDALHQGAFARHLTRHAVELAIILEEALSRYMDYISRFMVRNPVCAEPWQPIGFVRQQMLSNSYSFLPVFTDDCVWKIVSDSAIATFLGPDRRGKTRQKRMAKALRDATGITLMDAEFVREQDQLDQAFALLAKTPVLLVGSRELRTGLVGILTAFDLL